MKVETRKRVGGFTYSLGSYPVEEFSQDEGYTVCTSLEMGPFEQRHEFEVAVSIEKLIDLLTRLSVLLPDEVYLILESYPRNATQRRVCLTDSVVSRRDFTELVESYARLWRDDGFIAFGAFSYDPPTELFLNEHKTVVLYTANRVVAEELLTDFGLKCHRELEPYYMSVEHIHSSVAERDEDGRVMPLRERIEGELFERFDFYDQTPSIVEVEELDPMDTECCDAVEHRHDWEEGAGSSITNWRCHVHGRLVVAKPGRSRDFDQVFHIAALDELNAVEWVRDCMRDANARMVRVKELVPVEITPVDLVHLPGGEEDEEGVWYESKRLFPEDVS